MERRQSRSTKVIDPSQFGVSFSLKQCRSFKVDQTETLNFLIKKIGFRRFRLMSYWNEHEKTHGHYDFSQLDTQIETIKKAKGVITLCLGVRQPRWPESHWPEWALKLPKEKQHQALYAFIEAVVKRYQKNSTIISWQLENEALNRSFGTNGDFSRERFKKEYALVKTLDKTRPIIMSTSNTWGIPLRTPRPNQFGFTLYRVQYEQGAYKYSKVPWWWLDVRAAVITLLTRRSSFIHELQAEPWGPKAIWEMSINEQNQSMSLAQLESTIALAKKTKLYPIDLWGGEWWYWRYLQNDTQITQIVQDNLSSDRVY